MSVNVTPVVEVFFNLDAQGADYFTIGDPTRGELDGSFGLSSGAESLPGTPVDVSEYAHSVVVSRGRTFELDPFNTGTCVVNLRNYDGRFLPDDLNPEVVYGSGGVTPGRRCRITVEGFVVFDGLIEDWDYVYRRGGSVNASFVVEDALAQLARTTFTEWMTSEQKSGARVEAVLDRDEVGFGANRAISDGVSTMQSDLVSYGSNVLNYLNLVNTSDLGRLYVSRDGVLTFRDRLELATTSVDVTFGSATQVWDYLTDENGARLTDDDGVELTGLTTETVDGLRFHEIGVQYGSEVLFTRVTVDREGGIAQSRSNAAREEIHGVRTLSLGGLLLTDDEESDDMAGFLLGAYSSPRYRVKTLRVIMDDLSETDRAQVLGLDLGSVVRVVWSPVGLSAGAISQTLAVEGVRHDVDVDGLYVVELELAPRLQEQVFIVEDAAFGVLDGVAGLAF